MQKNLLKYFISAIISVSIWGFFAFPLRNLQAFPSEEILYYRVFMSLLFIWLLIFIFRKKSLKADRILLASLKGKEKTTLLLQTILSSVLLTLNWYTFIYAINNVSLTSAAFAYMVCPLITAFGGYILLKEVLTRVQLISLGVALLSIALLANGSIIEVVWSVVIAALYAFYLILQRKMKKTDKLNMLAVQITISAILMLPFYLYNSQPMPEVALFWSNMVIIALIFTILPLFLSLYALVGLPSSTVGIIIYLNPIIAFAVAILYFDTVININQIFAYLLLLFSVFLFNWELMKEIAIFKRK